MVRRKSPRTKVFLEKGPLVKKIPEKAFSVKGMLEKSIEGSWRNFNFLAIDPTRRPHTHQKMLNAHPTYTRLLETHVRGTFFWDL